MEFMETWTQLDPLYLFPPSPRLSLSPASSNAFFPLGSLPRQRHCSPHSTPPMSWSEICRSKNIHPLYPNNSKKKCCSWTRSGRLFSPGPFLWFLRTESLRLMSNFARTGNACNLSCQNVSHALQFRSKHLSVARCVYKQTYQSGFADNVADFMFFPTPQEYKVFST